MITFSFLGLDQYVSGQYSKDHTRNLADLYEVSEDDIMFYAPYSYVFHKGVEQTSWNCIVRVEAPMSCKEVEPRVAKYILDTLCDFCINIHLQFYYFDENSAYTKINNEYPRFITEENAVRLDASEDENNAEDDFTDIFNGIKIEN